MNTTEVVLIINSFVCCFILIKVSVSLNCLVNSLESITKQLSEINETRVEFDKVWIDGGSW